MTRETLPQITPEQLAALQDFARRYGRDWKNYLRAAWAGETWRGIRPSDTGPLRDVRNTFGPSWLTSFRLPS